MKGKPILMADMSGSLGGITAYTGKAGQIFRIRSHVTQPNSLAQIEAKATFGSGAGIFRALSGINKALWNNFAGVLFSPRNTTNTGQFSGQQALQSLATSFRNALKNIRTFSVKVNTAVLAGGETFDNYAGPGDTAPVKSMNSSLKLTTGGSVPVTITSGVVTSAGIFSFLAQVGDGSGSSLESWQNSNGVDVGYAVFMSSGNPSANMNYKSKYRYNLGYFNHITATVPADISAVQNFELTSSQSFPIASYKRFPGVGETVLLSVFAVDVNNQMSLVGSVNVVIS